MSILIKGVITLPRDLQGKGRGNLNVLFDLPSPSPKYLYGNFIELDGQLYEVIAMYRLATDRRVWYYVIEPRKQLLCAEIDDVMGQLYVSCCVGQHIPRTPDFLFLNQADAVTFFADIPVITPQVTVIEPEIITRATIVSSGEIIDDAILARREAIASLAQNHWDILSEVLSGELSLEDALESLRAMEMARADMLAAAADGDLDPALLGIVKDVNAFLRDGDPRKLR